MRSVFVFPSGDRSRARAVLDGLTGGEPWVLPAGDGSGPAVYARLDTPDPADWPPEVLAAVGAACGREPDWMVTGDVSGRVDGGPEVRLLVRALLAAGGVALDDHSDHPWTSAEIDDAAFFAPPRT